MVSSRQRGVSRRDDSIASSDLKDYASVYSEGSSYADYYAKFGSTEDDQSEEDDRSEEEVSEDDDDDDDDEDGGRDYDESEVADNYSVAESFDSVETPSVQSSVHSTQSSAASLNRHQTSLQGKVKGQRQQQGQGTTSMLGSVGTSISIASIASVATPSVVEDDEEDDEKMMDESDIHTVVSSVMQALISSKSAAGGNRKRDAIASNVRAQEPASFDEPSLLGQLGAEEIAMNQAAGGNDDSAYEKFMDDFKNKSNDIVMKQSTGLMQLRKTAASFGMAIPSQEDPITPTPIPIPTSAAALPPTGRGRSQAARPPSVRPPSVRPPTMASPYEQPQQMSPQRDETKQTSGFFGFRSARSKSPSPKQTRHIFKDDVSSFGGGAGFIDDMSEPSIAHTPAAYDASKNIGETNAHDLALRKKANVLLMKRNFNDLVPMLQGNPSLIGIQYEQSQARNFFHLLAIQQIPVPENVILKIISQDPSLVAVADSNGNTPLHYAALNAKKGNMHVFLVFLKFNPLGTMQRNNDGDLPLHLAAANPNKGAQNAVHMLLESNTKTVTEPNNKGKIPLHLALTVGSKNLKTVKIILHVHKARNYSVGVTDNRGKLPQMILFYCSVSCI